MTFGKLYSVETNLRTIPLRVIAKAHNLDVQLEKVEFPVSADFLKINPVGKIPVFVGSDGYVLSECIAIAIYFTSQNERTSLLGETKEDRASILKWMSFSNTDVPSALAKWGLPLLGREPYNKKNVDAAIESSKKLLSVFEKHLLNHTFLVTEKLTLADIFVAGMLSMGFSLVFDRDFRAGFPNLTRWYTTVVNQDIYKDVIGETKLIDEAIKYTPPKKEEKKKEAPKPHQG